MVEAMGENDYTKMRKKNAKQCLAVAIKCFSLIGNYQNIAFSSVANGLSVYLAHGRSRITANPRLSA